MRKKYFFFDIDGTLTTKNPGGVIPESTHMALRQLKQKGHFVAIATGRAECMAREFAQECQISNMVHDGGNGLTVDGQIVYIKPLERAKALKVIHECVAKNIPMCLALDNSLKRYSHNHLLDLNHAEGQKMFDLEVIEGLDYDALPEIFKIFIGLQPGEEKRLETLHELGYTRYHENHIIVEPDDKVQGIRDMMDYLQAPFEDVVVFGDGHNDLSMIQAAPISVAMGNAIDEVKALATYVTSRSDEDGIAKACRHFGWIE